MSAASAATRRIALPGGGSQNVKAALTSLAAVLVSLLIGGALMAIAGGDPVSAYRTMVDSAFGSPRGFGQVLVLAVPLVIMGLGLAIAFQAGVYNIGAEGQLYMGGLAGGAVAVLLPIGASLPLIALSVIAGTLAGAAWGGIVGALRARWGVNEVITSLLLNFVAILVFTYCVRRPLRAPEAIDLQGRAVSEDAVLPTLGGLGTHIGLFVALALVPLAWYLMERTPLGLRIRTTGMNAEAARTAGIRTGRIAFGLMALSGGLAGLAGVIQVLGVTSRLDLGISVGYGFTAIVVALLGRLNAVGVVLAAVFIAALQSGGQAMSVTEGLPYSIVIAIPGVFIVFLLIAGKLGRG